MNQTVVIEGEVCLSPQICGEIDLVEEIDGEIEKVFFVDSRQPYTGPTEVTPSEETQILETVGLNMTSNITVNPIPSNWGKITWDGSALTVS